MHGPVSPAGAEFDSLSFPKGVFTMRPRDIAIKLGCTVRHVYDLVEEGKIRALNIAGGDNSTDRRFLRVPREAWHAVLVKGTV